MSGAPVCEECEHLYDRLDGKRLPVWRWLCLARPVEEPPHGLSRTLRLTDPYERCSRHNQSFECTLFAPKRGPAGEKERGGLRGATPDKKLFIKCNNQASEW